jgi:hypothetical protein
MVVVVPTKVNKRIWYPWYGTPAATIAPVVVMTCGSHVVAVCGVLILNWFLGAGKSSTALVRPGSTAANRTREGVGGGVQFENQCEMWLATDKI